MKFSLPSFLLGIACCIAAIVTVGIFGKSHADWLTVPLASYHFERNRGYNEVNLGIGYEHVINEDWRIAAGYYRNSIRKDSYYAGAVYAPWSLAGVRVGTALGLVTGYGGVLPMAVPTLMWEGKDYGVNLIIVPRKNGVVGLQLKRQF